MSHPSKPTPSADNTQLIVISGRSGSGKSTALHVLEDVGYTCIDNLPASMLVNLLEQIREHREQEALKIALHF